MAAQTPSISAQISDMSDAALDLVAAGDPHHLITLIRESHKAAVTLEGSGNVATALSLVTSVYRHAYSLATEEDRAASIAPYGA